jgi:NAD(P)-dependent dehydrogenase (short-subunit alcohol dehydrogenase family)
MLCSLFNLKINLRRPRLIALVNNTGGPPAGNFDAFDDEAWQKAYELKLLSYIRAVREVIPYMRKSGGGRILCSTSSPVKAVLDNLILSNTFRMGVVGLAKTLSQELGSDNILVNVIGAGLDVYEKEPIDMNNPLLKLSNVLILPHIGSATEKIRNDMAMLAAENMVKALYGEVPPNIVPKLK